MSTLENFLHELQQAEQLGASQSQVELWGQSPLLEEHELLQAAYAVLAQRFGINASLPQLTAFPGGAVALFGRGFFPWKALPYPKEHAQLGVCLAQLGDRQKALSMARFQEATLDHAKQPVYSLFMQEGFPCREALSAANASFFETIQYTPADRLRFSDGELGMVARRTATSTVICVGSGCKSGLGVFLHHDAGILNWGPQTSPIGVCEGFGLAGRAQKIRIEDDEHHFELSFQCRLASSAARETGFSYLRDAGYSAQWMEAVVEGDNEKMTGTVRFQAPNTSEQSLVTFFGRARTCLVAGSHKLKPRSLDRYGGPPQPVDLVGALGNVRLEGDGVARMEIIPLAGDESFWGADFLIAYTLKGAESRFTLQKND